MSRYDIGMTATMNVSLPESMRRFVERRVRQRGYASSSEYFRELVRRDEEVAEVEHLRALVKEGLESPIVTSSTWDEFKRKTLAKVKRRATVR